MFFEIAKTPNFRPSFIYKLSFEPNLTNIILRQKFYAPNPLPKPTNLAFLMPQNDQITCLGKYIRGNKYLIFDREQRSKSGLKHYLVVVVVLVVVRLVVVQYFLN